jgi:hypothetical protein
MDQRSLSNVKEELFSAPLYLSLYIEFQYYFWRRGFVGICITVHAQSRFAFVVKFETWKERHLKVLEVKGREIIKRYESGEYLEYHRKYGSKSKEILNRWKFNLTASVV